MKYKKYKTISSFIGAALRTGKTYILPSGHTFQAMRSVHWPHHKIYYFGKTRVDVVDYIFGGRNHRRNNSIKVKIKE